MRLAYFRYLTEVMQRHVDLGPNRISYTEARHSLGLCRIPIAFRGEILTALVKNGYLKRENRQCLLIISDCF